MQHFSNKLEITGVVQMSGVSQHNQYPQKATDPCSDPHGSSPSADQPTHLDQSCASEGISVDLGGLLKVPSVDLSLPVSVEASSGEGGIGGIVDIGGDGQGLPLLSFDSDTDALVNVGVHDGGAGAAIDVGTLLNAAVLDIGGTSGMESFANCDAYDGNVTLAGDLSSALGATLDHLTTTSSLFDVPALDILCLDGLDT
jgi:hypothetical protein